MNHPNVTIEDVLTDTQEILLLCQLTPTDSVIVTCWYDHDRECGLSSISDNNGDNIPLDPGINNLLLSTLDRRFNLTRKLRDHLEESDCDDGLCYRSRPPIDWDTIAKEGRCEAD